VGRVDTTRSKALLYCQPAIIPLRNASVCLQDACQRRMGCGSHLPSNVGVAKLTLTDHDVTGAFVSVCGPKL
jgi:hypothetical protein